MYQYAATIVKVTDADTFHFDVDLGFYVQVRIITRLARVDAWETRGAERKLGLEAKKVVSMFFDSYPNVTIQTKKTGKYGRWIVEVIFPQSLMTKFDRIDSTNLSDILLQLGHAEKVTY